MAKVDISHPLIFDILSIVCTHGKCLTLSIEGVDHVLFVIVETFVWEVLRVAVHLLGENISDDLTLGVVIYKMIVHKLVVVENLNEQELIGNERACAERIRESLDWHGEVIDAQSLVDVEFSLFDFFRASGLLAKHS